MAMVATGPMPGSTPINVPKTQPMKQYSRLIGVRATPKPVMRFVTRSMSVILSARDERRPDRELQLEQHDEGQVASDREDGGEDQVLLEAELVPRQAGHESEAVDRDNHPHGRQPDAGQA